MLFSSLCSAKNILVDVPMIVWWVVRQVRKDLDMEEYVTKREFIEFKKQVEQRQTGEMKAINVNVGSQDVIDRLDKIERQLGDGQKELKTVSNTWLDTLQEHYTEHKEDLKAMATKDDLAKMKEELIDAIRRYSQPGKN